MPSTIFVVDDEKNIRRTVRMVLEGEGFAVEEASSGEEALARCPSVAADVMLLDVQLPGISGLETIERIAKLKLEAQPTILDHLGARDARRRRAGDQGRRLRLYREAARSRAPDGRAAERARAAGDGARGRGLRAAADERYEMIGTSAPMAALFPQIDKVAPTRTRVLITGESGTGKELVARAIHLASARATSPSSRSTAPPSRAS